MMCIVCGGGGIWWSYWELFKKKYPLYHVFMWFYADLIGIYHIKHIYIIVHKVRKHVICLMSAKI